MRFVVSIQLFWLVEFFAVVLKSQMFQVNGLGLHLLINIVLFLLGFIPAIIHAFWLVLKADSADSHAKADAQAVA